MKKTVKVLLRQLQNFLRKLKLAYYMRDYKKVSQSIDLADVESIAILRWDGKLGDAIMMGAFISLIEQYRPDIKITVLASGLAATWARRINKNINVIQCGKIGKKAAKELRQYAGLFDAVIDLSSHFTYKELLAIKSLKPRMSIGYDTNEPSIFDIKIPHDVINFKQRYIKTAQLFIEGEIAPSVTTIPTPVYKQTSFNRKGMSQVAINLFGASSHRQFSYNSAKELIINWLKEWPNDILVLLPVPNCIGFLKNLVADIHDERLVLPEAEPSIEFSLGVISSSDCCFTPDTSVVHMASSLNVPTLAVYSADSTNYQEWKPLADKNQTIFNPLVEDKNEKSCVDYFSWSELVQSKNKLLGGQ